MVAVFLTINHDVNELRAMMRMDPRRDLVCPTVSIIQIYPYFRLLITRSANVVGVDDKTVPRCDDANGMLTLRVLELYRLQ